MHFLAAEVHFYLPFLQGKPVNHPFFKKSLPIIIKSVNLVTNSIL